MSIWAELRRRKVARVAAAYLVVSWLVLQVVDVVAEPLSVPVWFPTVAILLAAIGFPIAVVASWSFDITREGVVREQGASPEATTRRLAQYSLLAAVGLGGGLLVWGMATLSWGPGASLVQPLVVLMDTPAPRGVYDPGTRSASGTNADDLTDVLRELPVLLEKETLGSVWDRDDLVARQLPALVVVHRSAFFHSMNREFGFGYPDDPEINDEPRRQRLYDVAEDKLIAFLGYAGLASSDTKFLIYSRGSTPGWAEDLYRRDWVAGVEHRFPLLTGRLTTMNVPGGDENATFRDPATAQMVRDAVRSLLDL